MADRLGNIFKKLDKIQKPHSDKNPWGLTDSSYSLMHHTRELINAALEIIEKKGEGNE